MSCINVVVNRINPSITVGCNKKSFTPKIQCSFVCSSGAYLQVSPETVQWISELLPIEYLVKSNTSWVVYT